MINPEHNLHSNVYMGLVTSGSLSDSSIPHSFSNESTKTWLICTVLMSSNTRTCVCTSASLNSMNQWLEKRPAFCRVRVLLLLSHTTRRLGRRRTSCKNQTHTFLQQHLKIIKTTMVFLTHIGRISASKN